MKLSKAIVPGVGVLALAVIAFIGYSAMSGNNNAINAGQTPTTTDVTTTVVPPVTTDPAPVKMSVKTMPAMGMMSKYTNGTYSASGDYRTPESVEHINVTVTLKNDIVTDVTSTIDEGNNDSKRFQENFLANYKQLVVGKNIDSLKLSQVSGSSLTSSGFNSAITSIKAQAKS